MSSAEPMLRVLRGEPTDAELAALVVVLASRTCARGAAPVAPAAWADAAALVRRPLPRPGPGAWRSALRGN